MAQLKSTFANLNTYYGVAYPEKRFPVLKKLFFSIESSRCSFENFWNHVFGYTSKFRTFNNSSLGSFQQPTATTTTRFNFSNSQTWLRSIQSKKNVQVILPTKALDAYPNRNYQPVAAIDNHAADSAIDQRSFDKDTARPAIKLRSPPEAGWIQARRHFLQIRVAVYVQKCSSKLKRVQSKTYVFLQENIYPFTISVIQMNQSGKRSAKRKLQQQINLLQPW